MGFGQPNDMQLYNEPPPDFVAFCLRFSYPGTLNGSRFWRRYVYVKISAA